MSEFLAKFGYTFYWGLGTPRYSLEENFDGYYRIGFIMVAILGTAVVILMALFVLDLIKERLGKK